MPELQLGGRTRENTKAFWRDFWFCSFWEDKNRDKTLKENKQMKKIILFLFLLANVIHPQSNYQDTAKLYDDTQVAVIKVETSPEAVNYMFAHPHSDSLHICTVHFENKYFNETIDSVGIRIRGNTSRDAKKKSFKISFNGFVHGRTFHGVDKMNLNGEHNDPSIVRSKLCWDIFQKIGMKASHAAHARVYINEKYYGLYISVEHIDDEFLKKNFYDPSGNLWKCLWPADLSYKGNDPSLYKEYVDGRRIYELKSNEDEDDYSQLARLIRIINKTPYPAFQDSLEKIFNVYEAIKYFAVNILVGSWDDYRFLKNNYYLYFEPASGKFHWIPYDYDNTFGVDWFGYDWSTINPYNYPTIDNTPRPLTDRLFKVPEYRNLFTHFLKFYSDNVFNLQLLGNRIDSLKQMILPFALADSFRTLDYGFTFDDFLNSYTDGDYSNQHVKMGLKKFVNNRTESLKKELNYYTAPPFVYLITYKPTTPAVKDSLKINASVFSNPPVSKLFVKVKNEFETTEEFFPLKQNFATTTTKVEDADRWSAVLPPLHKGKNDIRIVAVNSGGLSESFPRGRKLEIEIKTNPVKSSLFVNEILAINDTTNADEYGEYDDWVEIFNSADSTIDLTNYYLTDSKGNLTKWQFPQGTKIDGKGFLLVWCDKDKQPGLHTNFKLSGSGEFVALTSPDGKTVLDSISFGKQTADVSYGRYPDGGNSWSFLKPTPGRSNILTSVKDKFIPASFSLAVFPNPLKSGQEENNATIYYSLPQSSLNASISRYNVSLIIYNSLGQRIKTLINKTQSTGKYKIKLTTKNLASGVYFVLLQTGKQIKAEKFLLLR